jgi:hypothetical protein
MVYSANKGEKLLEPQAGLKSGVGRRSHMRWMENNTSRSWAALGL